MAPTWRTRRWCAVIGRHGAPPLPLLPPLPLPPAAERPAPHMIITACPPHPDMPAGGTHRLRLSSGIRVARAAGGLPQRRCGVGVARHDCDCVGPADCDARAAPGGPPVPGGQLMLGALHSSLPLV